MNGVEILAAQEVVTEYAYNLAAFWIIFCVFLGVSMVVGIAAGTYKQDGSYIFCIVLFGIVFGTMFGLLAGAGFQTPVSYTTEYKVTISDEVLMSDFFERYEIIDQEGKIFTVREKDGGV